MKKEICGYILLEVTKQYFVYDLSCIVKKVRASSKGIVCYIMNLCWVKVWRREGRTLKYKQLLKNEAGNSFLPYAKLPKIIFPSFLTKSLSWYALSS